MKCEICDGSGYVAQTQSCPICNGVGYVDEASQCPDCGGSGYVPGGDCRDCGGSGTLNDEQCGRCRGSGKEDDCRCSRCEGTGQITQRRDCPAEVSVQIRCEPCGGTGTIPDPVPAGGGGGGSGSSSASAADCALWRQQLAEKRSYRETWLQRRLDAQNEYDAATTQLELVRASPDSTQSEITRATNLVNHWEAKREEARKTYSELNDAFRDLEFKILNNCG